MRPFTAATVQRRPARTGFEPAARTMTLRRIQVEVDTGGTFTDVVAFDEDGGELVATKTPSARPTRPRGFMAGVAKVLAELEVGPDAVTAVCHGTAVAHQPAPGGPGRAARPRHHRGVRGPAGDRPPERPRRLRLGSGYFLGQATPDRPRRPGQDRRRPALDHTGAELRPFDEARARAAAASSATGR